VKLWDVQSGVALQTLEDHYSSYANALRFSHSGYVRAVVFSPDGKTLASASDNLTVKLWEARSGVALQTLKGHSDDIRVIAFSPDSRTLASASDDLTVKMWDARSGAALQMIQVDAVVNTLSFSDDGTYLNTSRGRLHSTFLSREPTIPYPISPASVVVKERRVSLDTRDIFWLPSEYAPSSVAVHKSMVGLGCPSGGVFIIEFDFRNFP